MMIPNGLTWYQETHPMESGLIQATSPIDYSTNNDPDYSDREFLEERYS